MVATTRLVDQIRATIDQSYTQHFSHHPDPAWLSRVAAEVAVNIGEAAFAGIVREGPASVGICGSQVTGVYGHTLVCGLRAAHDGWHSDGQANWGLMGGAR